MPQGHTAAKRALIILLKQNNNDLPALRELSQWYLNDHNLQAALPLLQRLHILLPENTTYAYQLAYVFYERGMWSDAVLLFSSLAQHTTGHLKTQAELALKAMDSYLPYYNYSASVDNLSASGQEHQSLNSQHLFPIFIIKACFSPFSRD